MIKRLSGSAAVAGVLFICGPALAAPINKGPPAEGRTILDLDGHQTSTTLGTVLPVFANTTFVATSTSTRLTFAMRSDHQLNEFLNLSDIVLETVQTLPGGITAVGPNVIRNGNFDDGSLASSADPTVQEPFAWTYDRPSDAAPQDAGKVIINPFVAPTTLPCDDPPCSLLAFPHVFADTSVGEYDALSQTISTVVGMTYGLSFSVWDLSQTPGFSRTDVEGPNRPSNGNDVVVSVADLGGSSHSTSHVNFNVGQDAAGVPEPAAWAMLIMGFFGLGGAMRARRSEAVA